MADRAFRNYIDGAFRDGASRFAVINPADGSQVGEAHEASRDDVDAAVQAAKAALKGPWGRMTTDQRAALLVKVADEVTRRFEEFVAAEMADTGQPLTVMKHAFVPRGAENFRMFAESVKRVPGEFFETPTPDGAGAINYTLRKPKGVIAVICPWNAPFLLMTWKVAPALACGNTVVVKPSEETPATANLLAEVMEAVGVPPGVYNVVNGFGPGSTGEFLTSHPEVDAITFTGETGTGSAIMKAAANGLRDVSFELGGKNAGLVFADCDIEAAANEIARATFINCGQVCLGTERLYVERPIFDAFVAALKKRAETTSLWSSWLPPASGCAL